MQHQILFKMDLTDEQYAALYDVCAVYLVIRPVADVGVVEGDAQLVLWMQDHEGEGK